MEALTHTDVSCAKNNLEVLVIGSIVSIIGVLLGGSLIDCIHAGTFISVGSSTAGGRTTKVSAIRVSQPARLGFNTMVSREYAIIIKS